MAETTITLTEWERQEMAGRASSVAMTYLAHSASGRLLPSELETMEKWETLSKKLSATPSPVTGSGNDEELRLLREVDKAARELPRGTWSDMLDKVQDATEAELQAAHDSLVIEEKICTDTAMSQWERSLKRTDLQEKDRVRGAIEAYKRQAFAFYMLRALKEGRDNG